MEGFLFANLLFFLFGIFLDLYLYLCSHKYRILVEYIHESYQRHILCGGFLFHFWTGSVFFITLLLIGFSAFEVLSYRWGIASVVLIIFGLFSGCDFRLKRKDLAVVFALSLLRG
jgi:hypothetical protein